MSETKSSSNFIKHIVKNDLAEGTYDGVVTRFPPEPNGYLHIGHAKSIVLNFELADEFGGSTNLRFDDTNPLKEDQEYIDAIKEDIEWLGYEWENLCYASNYFDQMYEQAQKLIRSNEAYVDDSSQEEIRDMRGTLKEPGKESPHRNRSVEENLKLFEEMKDGKYKNGEKVLRAKIDMASPNINLRDPVLYRISHTPHHHTGDTWCIYPMYTYAHPMEDVIEGVTHSICTLEFQDQRPFYDWVVARADFDAHPKQIEFARLNLTNTVMSKRKLKELVDEAFVDGWDDPRMPTISGLRRRGFTAESVKQFCREIGVAKADNLVDVRMLEHFVREDLKMDAPRTMSVLKPLKVIITNYPEGEVEWLEADINPENPEMGTRMIPFSREIYIEQEDFMEDPPKKYFRLFPGNEVRIKHAYFIKCHDFVKDDEGNVVEVHCTYDPETKSGSGFEGRKVKGTLHFVEATKAVPAEFRLYDSLINDELSGDDFLDQVNPDSLEVTQGFVEENMNDLKPQDKFQFFRHGYFNVDPKDSTAEKPVFNRIVSLKSSFKL
ncbi:glutamine--tRNA ligase/YqeY domain fusion protein [Salisediminibacterium selenitireducens]|uniref:Glutamine--tRNA ligase n=1 Tax=Bacillus selenitireducens (strain ATCC 700615 / DSM 15326 / MLS10) TaxID=439292 RepID=D6Y1E9_BACIE|nr:glutamine--tRNA ligase/YqeY domain fusion protein [Salisediminibacterium selenitireducens]ADI00736.1 glutaminyl-tRNA synthetase [[Bacillus] selenitireducens MLS10]